ncbi:hypothetical protein BKM63_11365 [Flavobacterium johnsoniae]|uniref:Surface antigen BspA-like n=2 Tax=Flavobacterium johnsoniae TaxID=986 RepID=A0A1J7CKV1_FLAJO|nr:hypothetical protein BKM63_11365 [Flavobacterium johnsoniae]
MNLFGAKFKNWQSTGGHAAFKSCSSLNITDFSALKSITHHSTFLNCSALLASSFNWNAFTTISGDSTFQGCISFIGSITLNMSGTLGINVFKGTKINSFTANNITSIQYGAFSLCSNLLTFQTDSVVTINSINTNFQTFESVPCVSYSFPALKTLGESTFKFNSFVQSFSAPELTNLEAQAFSQSVNLNYCNIPKVINLGNSAFNGCKSLPSFSDSHFDNVLVVSDSLFAFCSNALFTRICFNNATSALATPFNGATNLSYIAIPKLKTTSNNFLFSNANVSTLIIPLVESLGSGFLNGFSGISALSIIDIPKCTTFTGGLSSVNKNMFARAKIGVVINVNIAMQTNNDGAPDFDLTWAITNKSAIVNYIT